MTVEETAEVTCRTAGIEGCETEMSWEESIFELSSSLHSHRAPKELISVKSRETTLMETNSGCVEGLNDEQTDSQLDPLRIRSSTRRTSFSAGSKTFPGQVADRPRTAQG